MPGLPNCSVLVRTWFGDDAGWASLVDAATTENEQSFTADVLTVNDVAFEGLSVSGLQAADAGGAMVSFLADERTFAYGDHPVLAVPVSHQDDDDAAVLEPFRVIASEIWAVENNLNLANMDWNEFAKAVRDDGVFRGFLDPQPASGAAPTSVEHRGAAASARLVETLRRGPAYLDRGPRGTVRAERLLQATPATAYDMATHMSFWMTHGAMSYPIEVGGPYHVTSGGDEHSRASLFGYLGAVKGHYRRLEPTRTVEMTWNWHAAPLAGTSPLTVGSYLGWETVVRWTISAGASTEQALVSVEHSEVPVEWVPDLTDFWAWNLEHMQVVIGVQHHLPRPS